MNVPMSTGGGLWWLGTDICLGLSTAVPIQRGWYQLDAVPFECGMSTLGKEYAILLKTKTKTDKEKRIKTMKLYHTECVASIGVGAINTKIAMTVGGRIIVVSIPNDYRIYEKSEDFREGDTIADWLGRNGKAVEE